VAWRETKLNPDEKQFGIYPPLPRRGSQAYRALRDNQGVIPLAGIKYADDHPYLKGKKPGGPTGATPSRSRSKTPKAKEKKAASTRRRSRTPEVAEEKVTTASAGSTASRPIGKEAATTEKPQITTTTADKKKGATYDVSIEEDQEEESSPSVVLPDNKIGERITIEMIKQEKDEEKKQKLMRRLEMQTLQDRIAYARVHGRYPSPERKKKREVEDDKKKQKVIEGAKEKKEPKTTRTAVQPEKAERSDKESKGRKHRHQKTEKQEPSRPKEEKTKKEDDQKSRGRDYKKPSH
jgi:hypothetical protein